MHEINVLPIELSWLIQYRGGYPELNRELTVPHTVVLPIELYLPFFFNFYWNVLLKN